MSALTPTPLGSSRERFRRRRVAVTLAILAVVSAAFAVFFLQVLLPFALPLFLAAVFAVLAMPLHERLTPRCGGRGWVSAVLIVVALVVVLMVPTSVGFLVAYRRAEVAVTLIERAARESGPRMSPVLERIARLTDADPAEIRDGALEALREGRQLLFHRAASAVGGVFAFLVNGVFFLFSAFFFLKDGRSIILAWEDLTPMEVEQDRRIRREFAVICRGVVLSTILAALTQALTLGIVLGLLEMAFEPGLTNWLILLTLLTFVCAMIPMVGAAAVWTPIAAWMFYEERYVASVVLILMGTIVIANVDNLIRIIVLQGSAGLHPLLALISVLGGILRMGVLGAFVGPVVVGVFVTLLRILKQQLNVFEGAPASPASEPKWEDHFP